MGDNAYIGQLIAAFFYLIVGVRLAQLASRTGEGPERLLAAMFFLSGVSYIVYLLAYIPSLESLWTPINFAGRVVYMAAPVLLAMFTRQVFRPEAPWSKWMVYLTAALMIGGVGGSVWSGDWEGFSIGNPWFWGEWSGYTVPFAWAGIEAFAEYRPSKRRLALGLCDPLVPNRLLLWSMFGTAQVTISVCILPQYMEYEQHSTFGATWDLVVGVIELLSVFLIFLVFFPPLAYRRWIAAGSAGSDEAIEER